MTRQIYLLDALADYLDAGHSGIDQEYLDQHQVTFDEYRGLVGNVSTGARLMSSKLTAMVSGDPALAQSAAADLFGVMARHRALAEPKPEPREYLQCRRPGCLKAEIFGVLAAGRGPYSEASWQRFEGPDEFGHAYCPSHWLDIIRCDHFEDDEDRCPAYMAAERIERTAEAARRANWHLGPGMNLCAAHAPTKEGS